MLRFTIQITSIVIALFTVLSYQACSPGFKTADISSVTNTFSITPEEFASSKTVYESNCASCHGVLELTNKRDRTFAQIEAALKSIPEMAGVAKNISTDDITKLEMILKSNVVVTGPNNCNADIPEFVGIQRLNREEYNNVMRDITGIDMRPSDGFPADARGTTFTNTAAPHNMDWNLAHLYYSSAQRILDAALAQNGNTARAQIVTCDPNAAAGHRACAEKIVKEFGLKAFRRPLEPSEVTLFMSRYDATRAMFPSGTSANQFDESLKAPLHMMLIAPQFLFRMIDRTTAGAVRDLSPYELASRLSFFIWGTIPDATLFNLAADKTILDKTVLSQQVTRMLKDPKSSHMVDAFMMQWLKFDSMTNTIKNKTDFPDFTDAIKTSMIQESRMLFADIIQKDASPYLILNANYTYLNQVLAQFYGLPGPQTGWARVDLTNTPRRGVLTHGTLLAITSSETESSIIKRGLYSINTLLCLHPMRPDLKPEDLPPAGSLEGLNPREKLEAHTKQAKCASCHTQIDPPGFALENFNAVGKYRDKYPDGDPVDSSGKFVTGDTMSNPQELGETIGKMNQFKSCFAQNIMTYALARDLLETDKCAADKLGALNLSKDQRFSEIVKAVVMSPQFLKQKGSN